jgi:predicted transcriptional regulator of viral defense system
MATKIREKLWEVALDQHGFVTTADAHRLGIPIVELGKLAARGKLERVGYGLYRFAELPVTPLDSYMEATLWPRGQGVLSHDTALDLYEFCDINPRTIHITIAKSGRYQPRRGGRGSYGVHREDLSADEVGRLEGIPIVKPAVAIRQCIETSVQTHLIAQAIERARATGSITSNEYEHLAELLGRRR